MPSNRAGPSTLRVATESRDDRLKRREESTSIRILSSANVLAAANAAWKVSGKAVLQIQAPKEPELEVLATKVEAEDIDHRTIDKALEKMDEVVMDLLEQTIIDALDNCNSDINKSFILCAICNALQDLLSSISRHNR